MTKIKGIFRTVFKLRLYHTNIIYFQLTVAYFVALFCSLRIKYHLIDKIKYLRITYFNCQSVLFDIQLHNGLDSQVIVFSYWSGFVRNRIMSHFINDDQPYKENRHSKPSVIRGQLSKISVCDSTSPLLKEEENRRYLKQKISIRLRHEEDKAHLRHNQSLMCNYFRLKHKLSVYGRSKSCKIQQYFDNVGRPSVRESIEEAKKISLKNDSAEREVMIGRKYNHQLAIKTAVLSEMQQLQSIKKRRKQVLNQYFNKSLSCYMGQICEKATKKGRQNPVICVFRGSKLQKKKKQVLFA